MLEALARLSFRPPLVIFAQENTWCKGQLDREYLEEAICPGS